MAQAVRATPREIPHPHHEIRLSPLSSSSTAPPVPVLTPWQLIWPGATHLPSPLPPLSPSRAAESVAALMKEAGFTPSTKRGRDEPSSSTKAGPPARRLRRNSVSSSKYIELDSESEDLEEMESDEEGATDTGEAMEEDGGAAAATENALIKRTIEVWDKEGRKFVAGTVAAHDPARGRHRLTHANGENKWYILKVRPPLPPLPSPEPCSLSSGCRPSASAPPLLTSPSSTEHVSWRPHTSP